MFKKVSDNLGTGFDFEVNHHYIQVRNTSGLNLVVDKNFNENSYSTTIYIPYNDKTVYKKSKEIIDTLRDKKIVGFHYETNNYNFEKYVKCSASFKVKYLDGEGRVYFNNFDEVPYKPMTADAKLLEGSIGFASLLIGGTIVTFSISPLLGPAMLLAGMGWFGYNSVASIIDEVSEKDIIPTIGSATKKLFHNFMTKLDKKLQTYKIASKHRKTAFQKAHKLHESLRKLKNKATYNLAGYSKLNEKIAKIEVHK
jgi:trehalose-6-phosphate synthase